MLDSDALISCSRLMRLRDAAQHKVCAFNASSSEAVARTRDCALTLHHSLAELCHPSCPLQSNIVQNNFIDAELLHGLVNSINDEWSPDASSANESNLTHSSPHNTSVAHPGLADHLSRRFPESTSCHKCSPAVGNPDLKLHPSRPSMNPASNASPAPVVSTACTVVEGREQPVQDSALRPLGS